MGVTMNKQPTELPKFPSCEVCPKSTLPEPALTCYNARHKYPSECPKDVWRGEMKQQLKQFQTKEQIEEWMKTYVDSNMWFPWNAIKHFVEDVVLGALEP